VSEPATLEERTSAVLATMAQVTRILGREPPTRQTLLAVRRALETLAARLDLFGEEAVPLPRRGSASAARTAVYEEPGGRLSLSLTALDPGTETRPHAHGTWAAIAAIEGKAVNRLYHQGPRGLELLDVVVLGPGHGLALMPEDIHAVSVPGPGPARLLQLYGLALGRAPRRDEIR